jgi:hypothetical protein
MVEYVNYSLIILAMLVALLIWLLLSSRSRLPNDPMPHADTARQRRLTKKKQSPQARAAKPLSPQQLRTGFDGDLSKVPTPWGWPHHEKNTVEGGQPALENGHAHSISDSFHHWTNRLVQEKHTVDDEEYRRRKEGWMRTLVEDRYGRSAMIAPAASAKPSEDPTHPQDRVDKPPGGRVDKIETRLLRKGQTGEISYYTRQLKLKKRTGLKDLKMPRGW